MYTYVERFWALEVDGARGHIVGFQVLFFKIQDVYAGATHTFRDVFPSL